MNRVLVSIARRHDSSELDLDLPTHVPISQLANSIAQALGWKQSQGYEVEVKPLGRVLKGRETLQAAGVTDGCKLIFAQASAQEPESVDSAVQTFVWKRLD